MQRNVVIRRDDNDKLKCFKFMKKRVTICGVRKLGAEQWFSIKKNSALNAQL